MFTQIQTHNDKALVTGAALTKLILERLQPKILNQMHTVDLTGKTNQEIMSIITSAGRTVEKWKAARKNLGLKAQFRAKESNHLKFPKDNPDQEKCQFKKKHSDRVEKKKFNKDRPECRWKKDYPMTKGIETSELERWKAAGECLRCAWPFHRKGSHKVKDCVRPIKFD
jgi:hypothetical protein